MSEQIKQGRLTFARLNKDHFISDLHNTLTNTELVTKLNIVINQIVWVNSQNREGIRIFFTCNNVSQSCFYIKKYIDNLLIENSYQDTLLALIGDVLLVGKRYREENINT